MMADGTPDFTDLLEAFDDTASLHGVSRSGAQQQINQMQSQYNTMEHLQQQLNNQFGTDQNLAQISQVNPLVYRTSAQLQQISANRPAPGISPQNVSQSFVQQGIGMNQSGDISTAEDQSFSGGSLGSMFLSSVESLLSDESTAPSIKIDQPQAQTRQTQRRPRQKQRQTGTQARVQTGRVLQNVNANTVPVSVYSKSEPVRNYAQSPNATQTPVLAANSGGSVKIVQVSSPPFVLPTEMQVQANAGNSISSVVAQQKYAQTPFIHPAQGPRQQILPTQAPNPSRPLSAASSTSDHTSRPSSVPQPSPSCGSSHSGDPATPHTPHSYNALTPQSYNAATPQGRSITPQQQQHGFSMSDVTQMPPNMTVVNECLLPTNDMSFPSHQSPIKPHNKSDDSLGDLPTPLKEAILSGEHSVGLTSETTFLNTSPMSQSSDMPNNQAWIQRERQGSGIYQNQGVQDFVLSGNVQAKVQVPSGYLVSSVASQLSNFPQVINSYGMVPQGIFDHNGDPTVMTSETLTQSQSKLLDQMAASSKSKRKSIDITSQQSSSVDSQDFETSANTNFIDTSHNFTSIGKQHNERNATMDLMDKASNTGAATVKELFDYEAISPVSDPSMSPMGKTNLPEETSENSLYSTTKYNLSKADLQTDHTISHSAIGDPMTDPVLMYLKHDNVTHAATTATPTNTAMKSFLMSNIGHDTFPSSSQSVLSNSFQSSESKVPSRIKLDTSTSRSIFDTESDVSYMFNTSSSVPTAHHIGFQQSSADLSIPNKDWQSSNMESANRVMSGGASTAFVAQKSAVPDQHRPVYSSSQSDYLKKVGETKVSPVAASKSPKSGRFGVNRRRSSDKFKSSLSRNSSSKSNSFDNDFGFGSDEPTIRLANKAPGTAATKSTNSTKQKTKNETLLSPRSRPASIYPQQKMGPDVKDAMEHLMQLQQQNEMLLKMKQYQAEQQMTTIPPQMSSVPVNRSQTTAKLATSASTNHYQMRTVSSQSSDVPISSHQTAAVTTPSLSTVRYQVSSAPAVPSKPTTQQTSTASAPSATVHYQVPTTAHSSDMVHGSLLREELKHKAINQSSMPSMMHNLPANVSQIDSRKDRSMFDYSVATHPEKTQTANSKSFDLQNSSNFYPLTTVVTSLQQQHRMQFVTAPNISDMYNYLPISSSFPSSQSYPVESFSSIAPRGSISSVIPQTFHSVSSFLTSSCITPHITTASTSSHMDYPTTFSTSAKTSTTTTSSSNLFDLDWIHREPDNHSYPQQKPKPLSELSVSSSVSFSQVIKTPQITTVKTSSSTILSPTEVPKVNITSSLPKPDLLSSPENAKKVSHNEHKVTKAPPASVPSTSPVKEPAPVQHEPKHHYGKKHRILEGSYPSSSDSHYKYNRVATNHVSHLHNQTGKVPSTVACSVLDKQRRYSKDRLSKPQNGAYSQGDNQKNIFSNIAEMAKAHNAPIASSVGLVTVTTSVKTSVQDSNSAIDLSMPVSKSSTQTVEKPKETTPVKDDQTGSMLSLFNSLLQEASKSAADTLKTKVSLSPRKEDKDGENKVEDIPSVTSEPCKTVPEVSQSVPSVVSAKPTMPSASTTPQVSAPTVPEKKVVKQIRPAATIPFNKRFNKPYPAIDDFATPKVSLPSVTTVPTTAVTSITKSDGSITSKIVTSTTKTERSITSKTAISTAKSDSSITLLTTATTSVSSLPISSLSSLPVYTSKPLTTQTSVSTAPPTAPAPISTVVSSTLHNGTSAMPDSVPSPASIKSPAKTSSLPKLRITAFRSSGGQVIHQASMVNASELDQSSHQHKHHHKKKKKKKKRKRHLSSSDYDSSVSSVTSLSSFEPTTKIVSEAKGEKASKTVDEEVEKLKPKKAEETVPRKTEKDTAVKANEKTKKVVPANPAHGKKHAVPAKRARASKESTRRKTESKKKEPIARYQPKSAFQAGGNIISSSSGTLTTKISMSLPTSYQRAPGKPPPYMNSSESKSGTVPTIQLVARNTKLLEATSTVSKTSTSPKIVSVKLSNTLASKNFHTQILPSSGLQYLVPGAKGQQRIILPNISSTMPFSIVSTRPAQTATTTYVPVTISPVTTSPASKSSFLLIQQSAGSSICSPVVFADAKNIDALKSPGFTVTAKTSAKVTSSEPIKSTARSTMVSSTMAQIDPPSVVTAKISHADTSPTDANSFQTAFSKLISNQNPIPVYSPQSPPAHLKMEAECKKLHQCLECRDSFMFQSSLEDHYERRCIMIKVHCVQCNQHLLFLNKCKLLMHARQHSDKGNGMQFNNAQISPLPLSMCKPRSKESFLSPGSSTASRRSTVSSEDERSSSLFSSRDDTLICTDCNFSAGSPEALEEHFQQQAVTDPSEVAGTSRPVASSFTCDMCNLTLSNQCSFNAHMRMHKKVAPHTCPECGQIFEIDGKDMDFNLHLSIECFHLSRMSCYKCRICSSIFKNGDLLRRHLEVRHLQTFFKCRDCPMAFKTQENIASHQRTVHRVVAATKTIHKCPLCDTVFTDNSPTQQLFLLQKHFEGHINHPSINITAYKCLFCNNIYERKSLLRDHLKSAHDVTSPTDSSCELTQEISKAELLLDIQDKVSNGDPKILAKKTAKKRTASGGSSSKEIPAKVAKVMSLSKKTDEVNSTNALIASGTLTSVDGSTKKGAVGANHLSNKLLSSMNPSVKLTRQPLKLRLKGMKTHSANNLSSKMQDGPSSDQLGVKADDKTPHTSASLCITGEDGKKIYPCNECGKEFLSSNSRLNHIRSKHRCIRTLYCCPHCPVDKIKFAKRISLVKHLKKVHKIAEITKQDIRAVSAHVPPVPAGQKFDASTVTVGEEGVQAVIQVQEAAESPVPHSHVRKKVTSLGRKNNGEHRLARHIRQSRQPSLDMTSSDDEKAEPNENENDQNMEVDESAFSQLRFPDLYKCAKCDYESTDRLVFQAHIIEHREDDELALNLGSMQQCTECGLCFASIQSHNKHLFIKHKIKRKRLLEKYDEKLRSERKADGSLPKSLMTGAGGAASLGADDTKKHKCSVCFRRFEDDVKLRTHMRTHGLAFVKSKHLS